MSSETHFGASGAARLAGVTPWTVWYWVKNGVAGHRLPAVFIGTRFVVSRRDLEMFLRRVGREMPA